MRRYRLFFVILIFIAVAASAVVFVVHRNSSNNVINHGLDIYYIETETKRLKAENNVVSGKSEEEIIINAVNIMKSKPKNEKLTTAVPENVEVIEAVITDGNVVINFSPEYREMGKSDEMYCRSAVLKTITGINFVNTVEIYVDGETLKKTDGTPVGPIGADDIITNGELRAEPETSVKIVTLYFANLNGDGLNAEERRIEVNKNQPIERYIVEELIKGPQEEGNIATVPAETKIRDISTMDGICYIDLSAEFVTRHNGGTSGETLTIYSIVNSLAALDNVERVQFLIEGERQEEYKGHISFGQPFEPDYDLVL